MDGPHDVPHFRWEELAGSRIRCLMLATGSREQVAERLNRLVGRFAEVTKDDKVMPRGFREPYEARIDKTTGFVADDQQKSLADWWFAVPRGNSPNWDLAACCTIAERPGLVLVEGKAHAKEIKEGGKPKDGDASNHERIGVAIGEANKGLNAIHAGWSLSIERHYQLSNRFAWSWKLASMRVPVVLVYLGFLNAGEMEGYTLFRSAKEWEEHVRQITHGIVPDDVWESELFINGTPLVPLIRSVDVRFENS